MTPLTLPDRIGRLRRRKGESDTDWYTRYSVEAQRRADEEARKPRKTSKKDPLLAREPHVFEYLHAQGLTQADIERYAQPVQIDLTGLLPSRPPSVNFRPLREQMAAWVTHPLSWVRKQSEATCDLSCRTCPAGRMLNCAFVNADVAASDGFALPLEAAMLRLDTDLAKMSPAEIREGVAAGTLRRFIFTATIIRLRKNDPRPHWQDPRIGESATWAALTDEEIVERFLAYVHPHLWEGGAKEVEEEEAPQAAEAPQAPAAPQRPAPPSAGTPASAKKAASAAPAAEASSSAASALLAQIDAQLGTVNQGLALVQTGIADLRGAVSDGFREIGDRLTRLERSQVSTSRLTAEILGGAEVPEEFYYEAIQRDLPPSAEVAAPAGKGTKRPS